MQEVNAFDKDGRFISYPWHIELDTGLVRVTSGPVSGNSPKETKFYLAQVKEFKKVLLEAS